MRTRLIPARQLRVGDDLVLLGAVHRISRITPYRGRDQHIGGFATAFWREGPGESGKSLFDDERVRVAQEDRS